MPETSKKDRFLRLADVKARTGLSRSTIYLNISKGTFPRHIRLSTRCAGWLESEIDAWVQNRISQRSTPLNSPAFPKFCIANGENSNGQQL